MRSMMPSHVPDAGTFGTLPYGPTPLGAGVNSWETVRFGMVPTSRTDEKNLRADSRDCEDELEGSVGGRDTRDDGEEPGDGEGDDHAAREDPVIHGRLS